MSIQQRLPEPLVSLEKTEPVAILKNEPFEFADIGMDIFCSSNEETLPDIKDKDIISHIICEDSIKSETKNILETKRSESVETPVFVKTENTLFGEIENITESENLNKTEDTRDRIVNKGTYQGVVKGANENDHSINNLETNKQHILIFFRDLNVISDSTDIVDWLVTNSFSLLNMETKLYIVKTIGKPRPNLVTLKLCNRTENRRFNPAWYDKCDWLTGSSVREKLFCWPCLLFSDRSEHRSWTITGYSDLKNLSVSIQRHSKSKEHIASNCKTKLFVKQNIVTELDSIRKEAIISYNKQVKENRRNLKKLIDAIIFLSSQGLSWNCENYKELLSLFAKHDINLNNFLGCHIFSDTIQNDLIESVSFVLREQIKKEIQDATFYSWQVNETTTDISCASQLSIVFRYVTKGKTVERFMGFYDVSAGRTAEDLFNFLISECDQYDFRNKLVVQMYDGAAVMAGQLNDLQTKIKSVAPQALFTHCHYHASNVVLSKACNSIKEFFSSLSGFGAFFSKSTKRTNVLNEICNMSTHWNFISKSVITVQKNRKKLIEVFDFIINSDEFKNDVESVRESAELKILLNDHKFCFMLETFKLIFEQSDTVQYKLLDIGFSKQRLTQLIETLKTYRSDEYFNNIYKSVVLDSDPFQKKRKSHLDLPDLKKTYKQIFMEIIDTIIVQFETRFCDLEKLDFFDLLAFEKFESYSRNFPQNLLDNMLVQYQFFDSVQLKNELSVLYNDPQMFHACKTPSELLRFIFQNDLITCVPELYKFVTIVITIPVSSDSEERNFSALKRIQNYSQNTQLSNISLISIEKELVREMCQDNQFYEDIIDYFARTKNQSIPLTFKVVEG